MYEDTLDHYRATDGFDFVPLPNTKFLLAKDLTEEIPEALLKEEDKTFGCPDCYDQGGIFIQAVSYTHLRAHETVLDIVCRLLLEKKNKIYQIQYLSLIKNKKT